MHVMRMYMSYDVVIISVTNDTTRKFCPNCGNNTLIRVSVHVDDNGVARYNQLHKPIRLRGTIVCILVHCCIVQYSIPKPHGGKKVPDMILAEDELLSVRQPWRGKKQREKSIRNAKTDADPDGNTGAFSEHRPAPNSVCFVYIVCSMLQIQVEMVGYGRRNPNERRKKKI